MSENLGEINLSTDIYNSVKNIVLDWSNGTSFQVIICL